MNDDENTARGGLRTQRAGPRPVVRATAPVGTPVDPAAPQRIPSDRPLAQSPAQPGPAHAPAQPAQGLTPPRTVGGHTARLNEAAAASVAASAGDAIDASGPGSRTVGGTMRIDAMGAPAAPAPAAPAPARAPAPVADTAPMAAVPAPPAPAPAAVPAPPAAGNVAEGIAWASPLPVAVGLVFFAVGSMITLAADGRFGGRAPAAAVTVAATATAAPTVTAVATAAHTAAPVASATATSTATASATTAPRPHTGTPPPRPPPTQKGKPGRPPLPF